MDGTTLSNLNATQQSKYSEGNSILSSENGIQLLASVASNCIPEQGYHCNEHLWN